MKAVILLVGCLSAAAFSSGWDCKGKDTSEWEVLLYNHTDPKFGTTNPAKLIVLQNESLVLERDEKGLEVTSTSKGTSYRALNSAEQLKGCSFTFSINFREGIDSIPNGARRTGYAELDCAEAEEYLIHRLSCKRYLKNP